MNGTVMGGIGWPQLREESYRRPTHDGRPKPCVCVCLCVISVPIVLNCEKTCLLGNTAVMAGDQKGRKMGQRLKIQCACAQVRLCIKVRVFHVSVFASVWAFGFEK